MQIARVVLRVVETLSWVGGVVLVGVFASQLAVGEAERVQDVQAFRLAYSDQPVWHDIKTARNHILPLWRHRYTMVSGIDPSGEVDGQTGATESHSFKLDPYLVPGEEQKFIVCVEINAPHDPNEAWSDETIGQPSLLYTAYIKVDEGQRYHILELTGHGGGAESSGNTQYDLEGFTSAKELADLFLVKLEPVE